MRWSRARAGVLAAVVVAVAATIAVTLVVVIHPASQAPVPQASNVRPPAAEAPLLPRIPAEGAYIGAWVRPATSTQVGQVTAFHSFEAQLGRQLDIVHTYLTWQGKFPTALDLAALRQGSMPLLSWAGTYSQAVASGADDSLIRQRALAIKATGKPVFLEWRWEMDRPNLRAVVGSPADFIAAWKHVRAIFSQEHVSNVAWVWCPTAKGFGAAGNASAYYPGDGEVDWICADAYPGFGPYRSFADTVQPFLSWASHRRKPVMIGEYGVPQSYSPAQRAQWLRVAAQTVRDDPQIKALVYFDSSPDGSAPADSFALTQNTGPLQAFRSIADSRYFDTRNLRAPG